MYSNQTYPRQPLAVYGLQDLRYLPYTVTKPAQPEDTITTFNTFWSGARNGIADQVVSAIKSRAKNQTHRGRKKCCIKDGTRYQADEVGNDPQRVYNRNRCHTVDVPELCTVLDA